jgi:cell fate regulator YaaT (PSP1 superfamily)
MKKVIVVSDIESLDKSQLKNLLIIGFPVKNQKGEFQFCKKNLEFYPRDNGKIEYDERRDELVIRIKVMKNQCVCIGDGNGDEGKKN